MDTYLYISFYTFFISFVLYSFFILYQKKRRIGQVVRIEGPKEHLKKNGTPTMGGIIFVLISILFIILNFNNNYYLLNIILIPFIGYFIIGLLDDLKILKEKNNKGVKPLLKFILQLLIPLLIYYFLDINTKVNIFNNIIDFKYFYPIFILLMYISTTNAVNLTDGIDGLASGLILINLITYFIIAYHKNEILIMIFILIIISALLSYFIFNFNPASIIMGNCGSLALGGLIVSLSILLKVEFYLIFFGFIYLIETLSVIIQVSYYKITKGKWVFLMTPIHHHFELKGYSEKQICFGFYLIQIIIDVIILWIIL